MDPQVAIVILNWNNAPDTIACLESLDRLEYSSYEVIVVDNDSEDDSVEAIRRRFPDVRILRTDRNLGYAGGNNVGIHHALDRGAEYVCILNNDVKVDPLFLKLLVTEIADDPDIGAVGPAVLSAGSPSQILSAGVRFDYKTLRAEHLMKGKSVVDLSSRPIDIQLASGSALLVRSDVFRRVGFLPERYFMYYEDADWCFHMREQGYKLMCVPSARVWHKVSASLTPASPAITYYMTRNRLVFLQSTLPAHQELSAVLKTVAGDIICIVGDAFHRRWRPAKARFFGLLDYVFKRLGPMSWRL